MYFGEVNLREDDLNTFINTAKALEIKGLSDCPNADQQTSTPSTISTYNPIKNNEAQKRVTRQCQSAQPAKRNKTIEDPLNDVVDTEQQSIDAQQNIQHTAAMDESEFIEKHIPIKAEPDYDDINTRQGRTTRKRNVTHISSCTTDPQDSCDDEATTNVLLQPAKKRSIQPIKCDKPMRNQQYYTRTSKSRTLLGMLILE